MRLLLVEDDERIAAALHQGLTEAGHQVDACAGGWTAARQAETIQYDVIVLDWMLPDIDGLSVLRRWRSVGMSAPVLMLTARGSVNERVLGLNEGADDYLVKPFDFEELLARISALHRRAAGNADLRRVGQVVLDGRRRRLISDDAEVELTPKELMLCSALFERSGDVVSRRVLLDEVWGEAFEGDPNVLDVYIGYVRKKLRRIGDGARVETVRGLGFRLVETDEGEA